MGRPYQREIYSVGLSTVGNDMLLFEDFEPTLFKWIFSGNGTGARITTDAVDGLASARLEQTNTSVIVNPASVLIRDCPTIRSKQWLLDLMYKFDNSSQTTNFTFRMLYQQNGIWYRAGYRRSDNGLGSVADQIETAENVWTSVAGNVMVPDADTWSRLKLTIDRANNQYQALILNSESYTVSGTPLASVTPDGNDRLRLTIGIDAPLDKGASLKLDNIIVRAT